MEKKQAEGMRSQSYGCKVCSNKQWHFALPGPFPWMGVGWPNRSTERKEKEQRELLFLASGSVPLNYKGLSDVSSIEENFV